MGFTDDDDMIDDDTYYEDDEDLDDYEDDDEEVDSGRSSASVNPFRSGSSSGAPGGGRFSGSSSPSPFGRRPESSSASPRDQLESRLKGSTGSGSPGGDRPRSPTPGGESRFGKQENRPGAFGSRSSGSQPQQPGSSRMGGPPGARPQRPGDDKSGEKKGGLLGGLTSRFGKGKDGDSPARPAKPKGGGGFMSRLKNPLKKKDEGFSSRSAKPKGQGGGIGQRLGGLFKKKGGDQPARPRGDGGRPAPSPGRGGFDDDQRRSGAGGMSPFARSKSDEPSGRPASRDARDEGKSGGFGRFKLGSLFGGGDDKQPRTSKTRASKVPHTSDEGLSLDAKLDILGVGLVFGALVLFFSSLSNEQGALTGTINTFFSQLLGWGAIAVPIAMLAAGIWLIIRHFGDEEPEIDLMRIFGVGMLYVGMLMIFMFIETFSELYQFATRETFHLFIAQSVELGRGGGRIGAELYTLLVAGLGEIPAMVMVIGWIFVALMLTTRTSAAELAVLIISIYRSFRVALQHRAQKRAALRLEQQARSAEQQRINVSGPQPAELPGGQSAALPASTSTEEAVPIEQRSIPIRMGGQMINAPVDAGEASAEAAPGAQTAEKGAAGGMIGGLASRLKSAVPAALPFRAGGDNGKEDHDDTTEGDSSPGGLRGLFNRRSSTSGTGEVPGSDEAAHRRGPLPDEQPTGEAQPAAPHSPFAAQTGAEERAAERYSRPASPFAPQRPRPQSPEEEDETPAAAQHGAPDDAPPEERVFGSRPAPGSPQRGGTLFSQRFGQGPPERQADRVDDEGDDEDEAPAATERGSLSDRLERLNAIRFGKNQAPQTAASRDDDEDDDDDEEIAVSGSRPPSPFEEPPRTLGGQSRPRPTSPFARPDDRSRSEADDEDDDDKQADQPPARRADPGRPAAFRIPSAGASTPPKVPGPAPDDEEEHPAPRRREPVINRSAPQQPASMPGPQQGRVRRQWRLPDYRTLLASGSEHDFDRELLVKRARTIEETLQSFGAPGRVVEINTGPVITQFGVEPDYLVARGGKRSRVKVSAIAQLDKDLQLSLGAKSIRIEAPVPGKGFVGVEVPNEEASLVSLRDVMEAPQFKKIKGPLAIALGQSVDGAPVAADLSSMPHLLIAGTTGSGKSVCVNSVIASLLVRNTPEQVKFIMVDPKRVELTGYNGIPHLIAPVVVELERIVGVLKWVTREMDERYKRFSNAGARNIEEFNLHRDQNEEPMPYIVVIIDELADLMMLAPDETERVVTRIAALARATGIHLVIATQRPSVDVVTGLIKANFPARVAFAVAGSVDSRVILDQPGAERLLGRGDMLYLSPESPAPLRLQGVFVSDMEINNINRFWRTQQPDAGQQQPITSLVMEGSATEPRSVMPRGERFTQAPPASTVQRAFWDSDPAEESSTGNGGRENEEHEDELYEEAVELVRRLNKASVSLLQRRLRIGYTRAARLIDVMEEEGIVGPPTEGSKPREVLPARD